MELDGWERRWIKSEYKKSEGLAGNWLHTAGKWYADPDDKGDLFSSTLFLLPFHCKLVGREMLDPR